MKRNETESIIDPISVQYTITYKHLCLYDPDYEKPATACMMILQMKRSTKTHNFKWFVSNPWILLSKIIARAALVWSLTMMMVTTVQKGINELMSVPVRN